MNSKKRLVVKSLGASFATLACLLQVVVATCAGAGDPRMTGRAFRMLVIDEATQATEPMTLIPLVSKHSKDGNR